jgi:hypothetical protein
MALEDDVYALIAAEIMIDIAASADEDDGMFVRQPDTQKLMDAEADLVVSEHERQRKRQCAKDEASQRLLAGFYAREKERINALLVAAAKTEAECLAHALQSSRDMM